MDFIAKLAALVPPPRAHLTRFHGIFAPNSSLRSQLTPSGRGKKSATDAESTRASPDERTPDQRRRAMSWAQRLKRVFGIDVSTCVSPATVSIFATVGRRGDANCDMVLTVVDVFYLMNHLFSGGPAPLANADANSDGVVTVADIFFLIDFLFRGGPAPAP